MSDETKVTISWDIKTTRQFAEYLLMTCDELEKNAQTDPHAELKAQYERDFETCINMETDDLPAWRLWQARNNDNESWCTIAHEPSFLASIQYRRNPHADSIIAFHKCSDADKKRWQWSVNGGSNTWINCEDSKEGVFYPIWDENLFYRLKPRVISVTLQNGDVIEFPEPVLEPLGFDDAYYIDEFDGHITEYHWTNDYQDITWLEQNRIFRTEEDCKVSQAAIQAIMSQRS